MNDENLRPKPWQPGQSGNAAGRPKGSKNVSTRLRTALLRTFPTDSIEDVAKIRLFVQGKRPTNADFVVARLLYSAIVKGEYLAIREILDRTEGKPVQPTDFTGALVTYAMTKEEWEADANRRMEQVSDRLAASGDEDLDGGESAETRLLDAGGDLD